jgi:hypothetical protein
MNAKKEISLGHRTLFWVCLCLSPLAILILWGSFAFDPSDIANGDHMRWLGLAMQSCSGCGLCGLSRAFSMMSHCQWTDAIELNPLVLLFWPIGWFTILVGPFYVWRYK